MKSLSPLILLLASSVAIADASEITSNLEQHHAQVFTDIVSDYCMRFIKAPEKLGSKLKKDGFKKSADYDDTYEKHIENMDCAVTRDKKFCTTDVLLKPTGTILFEVDQIESTLISRLKLSRSKNSIDYELSINDKQTKVIKREYLDRQGDKYLLVFPLENQDEYYMTFDVFWKRD